MKKNYLTKRSHLIHYNRILSRLVVYKKGYDISRKGFHRRPTPQYTNPRV